MRAYGIPQADWFAECLADDLAEKIGMATFCYKTGVHPISLETAPVRMVLNQDGSMQLCMGATEIGQGADTVFSQGRRVQRVFVLIRFMLFQLRIRIQRRLIQAPMHQDKPCFGDGM